MNRLPRIAVTMGDPAGIGPEIVIKACMSPQVREACLPVVLGDLRTLQHTARACNRHALFRPVQRVADVASDLGSGAGDARPSDQPPPIHVLDFGNVDVGALRFGEVQGMCGAAAVRYVEASVDLCLTGEVAAVATAPINKEALKAAGSRYTDHTQIYGELTATPEPLTMFEVLGLRIFFLTRHVSLAQACALVKRERVVEYLRRCTAALERLGLQQPSIAVAGLNPHAGEHGLFGREEVDEIEPAIAAARAEGLRAAGPVPADSVFHQARHGRYDAVLSLYHDQGHIAAKMVDFERTVSITNGLPFLRTSVDHGTAFDIAGQGVASAVSMVEAILAAARYAPRFSRGTPPARG